jgi:hypothetical protein
MAQLPDAVEQVLQLHAQFLHAVVTALRDRGQIAQLHEHLKAAEDAGWGRLASAIRRIDTGERGPALHIGLDDEDRILVDAILRGLDNPASLPPLTPPDGRAAAPGLAAMIHAAGRGDTRAFAALANMAEQMMKAGGDMARLAAILRRMVDGEHDPDRLTRGMGPLGRELVINLLDELARLRPQ